MSRPTSLRGVLVGKALGLRTKGRDPYSLLHAHVKCLALGEGRTLLGDVREVYYDREARAHRLRVTFFNGEPWPFDPLVSLVEVLERES